MWGGVPACGVPCRACRRRHTIGRIVSGGPAGFGPVWRVGRMVLACSLVYIGHCVRGMDTTMVLPAQDASSISQGLPADPMLAASELILAAFACAYEGSVPPAELEFMTGLDDGARAVFVDALSAVVSAAVADGDFSKVDVFVQASRCRPVSDTTTTDDVGGVAPVAHS